MLALAAPALVVLAAEPVYLLVDTAVIGVCGLSAEHGQFELAAPSATPALGDRIRCIVGYGDTTVHLHETMVGVRDGRVEIVWPILGRGRLQ